MTIQTSPINLDLPQFTKIKEELLRHEIQTLINAIRILQTQLDLSNERIAALEQYNIDFP